VAAYVDGLMNGGMVPRLLFSLENLKNIQEMIRFADQKAGAVLVVYGFLITIYGEIGKGLLFALKNPSPIGIATFILGLMSGAIILNEIILILLKVVRPRLASNYNPDERCLYYFDHITSCTKPEVIESILNIDETKMVSDIATQIHENAKILNSKLAAVKSSINRLVFSGIFVAVYALLAKLLEVM
jgi:hypothetical protein